MRACFIVLLGLAGTAQAADSVNQDEAFAWLRKMATASRQQNYSGTIVYQHGGQVETSRVVHFVNSAGGEFEKLEALDGPAREVVRSNDQVICYLPSVKTVLIEERSRSARNFPALLPESVQGIAENYVIRKEGIDRVAGYDCQWIALAPRDNLRYGRRFCAELGSSLPLRAQTLNEKGEPIESFGFTQLGIGGSFMRERVKSKYAEKSRTQNWRIDRSGVNMAQAKPADTGWIVANPLPGFKKLMEAKRSMVGRSGSVSQIVLSDGLAAISIFVEPMSSPQPQQIETHQGAVNIYKRPYGSHIVTVIGEAPQNTIKQIANSLELRPTTAAVQ